MKKAISALIFTTALSNGLGARADAANLNHVLVGYTISSWTAKNGLPSSFVSTIAQDSEGYLWVGTEAGLVRFDGVRFVSWEKLGSMALPSRPVKALCVSRDGSIWVGFGDRGGISRIRNRDVRHFGEENGLAPGAIASLVEDAVGTIWAGTNAGLYRLVSERWERLDAGRGLPMDQVSTAHVDHRGHLFVATPTGVFRFDEERYRFHQIEVAEDVRALSDDLSGTMWVTDPILGFRRLGEAQVPTHSRERGLGIQLLHDRAGDLWVGTGGQGLWRARHQPQTTRLSIEKATALTGLLSDGVLALLEDQHRNIWVGTTEGLQRFTPHKVAVANLGLVRGVEASSTGDIWIGTVDGLVHFSQGTLGSRDEHKRLRGSLLTALRADKRGLWVATERKLLRFADERWFTAARLPGGRPHQIYSITCDSRGRLWLYDRDQGLLRWDGGRRFDAVPLPIDLRRSEITSAYTDKVGRMWLGFAQGPVATITANGHFQLYGPKDGLGAGPYYTTYESADGVIWLGGDGGLTRFAHGTFATLQSGIAFPARRLTAIIEDEAKYLWVGTSSGILRIEPAEFDTALADRSHPMRYKLYDRSDGLAGFPLPPNRLRGNRGAIRAHDGRLWFVTTRGATVIDPRALRRGSGPAPVRIESVIADGQPWRLASQSVLPPGTKMLEILYTLLDLTSPPNTRFRYRLEGLDTDWTEASTRPEAIYRNLPPHRYRFRVVADNNDGTWADPGAVWEFSIKPSFYQTTWFQTGCIAALVLAVWGAWLSHVRQVRKRFAVLIGERVRLSREIHDTLLQSLVGVALQCEVMADSLDSSAQTSKEQLVRMRKQVEEYIRDARQSIWNLRSTQLESSDLAAALREAGERARAGAHVTLDFSVRGVPRRCSPRVEEELLRIGQEAIINAIRHGQASRVRMALHYENGSVALRVSDDGRGFDPQSLGAAPGRHYGLAGMRERAANLGGSLTIVSSPGRGTDVETVVPIYSRS